MARRWRSSFRPSAEAQRLRLDPIDRVRPPPVAHPPTNMDTAENGGSIACRRSLVAEKPRHGHQRVRTGQRPPCFPYPQGPSRRGAILPIRVTCGCSNPRGNRERTHQSQSIGILKADRPRCGRQHQLHILWRGRATRRNRSPALQTWT